MPSAIDDSVIHKLHRQTRTKSVMQLSHDYYCDPTTIYNTLKRNNLKPYDRKENRRDGIIRDWNANVNAHEIVRRYGLSSVNSLHQTLRFYRSRGHNVISRRRPV